MTVVVPGMGVEDSSFCRNSLRSSLQPRCWLWRRPPAYVPDLTAPHYGAPLPESTENPDSATAPAGGLRARLALRAFVCGGEAGADAATVPSGLCQERRAADHDGEPGEHAVQKRPWTGDPGGDEQAGGSGRGVVG